MWVVLVSVFLVSCSQGPTPAADISSSASPDSTTAPLPSPSGTPSLAPPTDTPLPTGTPTQTPIPWPTSEDFFDGARVTFIDNAGFLIAVKDKKILIDGLFEAYSSNTAPPQEVIQRAVNAEPPFDQIDLVLATHSHADHFSADLVRGHLRNNPRAVFVSAPDAVEQINRGGVDFSERLISVDLKLGESAHLSVNGIELDCMYITHGSDSILNMGMVITVDEYTFFHSGDMALDNLLGEAVSLADLQEYGLPHKGIDLALLPSHIFLMDEYLPLIEEGIRARFVSPMHYPYRFPPAGIEESFSNAVVFKDTLEEWVVPLE